MKRNAEIGWTRADGWMWWGLGVKGVRGGSPGLAWSDSWRKRRDRTALHFDSYEVIGSWGTRQEYDRLSERVKKRPQSADEIDAGGKGEECVDRRSTWLNFRYSFDSVTAMLNRQGKRRRAIKKQIQQSRNSLNRFGDWIYLCVKI